MKVQDLVQTIDDWYRENEDKRSCLLFFTEEKNNESTGFTIMKGEGQNIISPIVLSMQRKTDADKLLRIARFFATVNEGNVVEKTEELLQHLKDEADSKSKFATLLKNFSIN